MDPNSFYQEEKSEIKVKDIWKNFRIGAYLIMHANSLIYHTFPLFALTTTIPVCIA